MVYADTFKAKMVRKMLGPQGLSAAALSREVEIHQTTLSRWKSEAQPVVEDKTMKKSSKGKRPQDWDPQARLEAVIQATSLSEPDLGSFLRSRGLHQADLLRWRRQMLGGLNSGASSSKKSSQDGRRIQTLEQELRFKDKALAEASALLVLQKKARAIWGDVDDVMEPMSGKGRSS